MELHKKTRAKRTIKVKRTNCKNIEEKQKKKEENRALYSEEHVPFLFFVSYGIIIIASIIVGPTYKFII